MKTKTFTKTTIIGMIATSLICIGSTAEAATLSKKDGLVKAINFFKKTANDIGNTIWNNKGSIAVGTAAVAVASKPEILVQPIVGGATTVATNSVKRQSFSIMSIALYLALTLLAIIGVRSIWNYMTDWKNWMSVPLLVVATCLITCGVTEAATLTATTIPVMPLKPLFDVLGILLFFITIFM